LLVEVALSLLGWREEDEEAWKATTMEVVVVVVVVVTAAAATEGMVMTRRGKHAQTGRR